MLVGAHSGKRLLQITSTTAVAHVWPLQARKSGYRLRQVLYQCGRLAHYDGSHEVRRTALAWTSAVQVFVLGLTCTVLC